MKLLVFDDMAQCTEEEVGRMLPLVSAQRREQALKFKHTFGQFACLKSFLMLQELLGLSAEDMVFGYNEHGKPSLPLWVCSQHFNISHCKEGIAVCVDNQPIGIDIESIREVDEALIRKTMNANEQTIIFQSSDPAEAFTTFWTRKEAVLKLRGTGIIDNLHNVLSGSELIETHICGEKHYVLSVAKP